jgi:hypothetical protein
MNKTRKTNRKPRTKHRNRKIKRNSKARKSIRKIGGLGFSDAWRANEIKGIIRSTDSDEDKETKIIAILKKNITMLTDVGGGPQEGNVMHLLASGEKIAGKDGGCIVLDGWVSSRFTGMLPEFTNFIASHPNILQWINDETTALTALNKNVPPQTPLEVAISCGNKQMIKALNGLKKPDVVVNNQPMVDTSTTV